MLRGAAPVNGHAARSTAARMETLSAKEPGLSRAESEAGIRVSSSLPRRLTFQLTLSARMLRLSQHSTNEPSDSASTLRMVS